MSDVSWAVSRVPGCARSCQHTQPNIRLLALSEELDADILAFTISPDSVCWRSLRKMCAFMFGQAQQLQGGDYGRP